MIEERENYFKLDKEAERLFMELGGIDTTARNIEATEAKDDLIEAMEEAENLLDSRRVLLVEFAYLLSNILKSASLTGFTQKNEAYLKLLIENLKKISTISNRSHQLVLRYRGRGMAGEGVPEKYDCTITYGALTVDVPIIKALSRRLGLMASHLPGRLIKAFEIFAGFGINVCSIEINRMTEDEIERLGLSVRILSHYYKITHRGNRLHDAVKGYLHEESEIIIYNENNQPDCNLTMLAGVNRLKPESMQRIVQKVADVMYHSNDARLDRFVSVYDAVFAFKNLKEQLKKPRIEINNVRWLMISGGDEVLSQEKVKLSRAILSKFSDSPQKTAKLMGSIYGGGYNEVDGESLSSRLVLVTDFLDIFKRDKIYENIEPETLKNMKKGLVGVSDEVLDGIRVNGNEVERISDSGETIVIKIYEKLADMLSFFKIRSHTKRKMKSILHHKIEFDDQDIETIAKDFGITAENAVFLIELLKGCFDGDGSFRKKFFEKNIPQFIEFEKVIFEFLWHYLKEIINREDRVIFLNSLQLLIAGMSEPQLALKVLIEDFSASPAAVFFSDRNSLILMNILIRKYNKELQNDIEITPEEVLLVTEGLNSEMIDYAKKHIENEEEKLFCKIGTIHKELAKSFQPEANDYKTLPARYLATLEREIFIFFSLVGGERAHRILHHVAKEYGNPQSRFYFLIKSPENMKSVMLLLQVAIRGLGRFGMETDLPLLKSIRSQAKSFLSLRSGRVHEEIVKRVMGWADHVIVKITKQSP